ncbi:MAG: tetratricopeptide repeat protein [Pseudomonadota bacterium]
MAAILISAGCGGSRVHEVVDVRGDVRNLNLRGNELYYQGDYEGAARMYDRAKIKALSVDDRSGVADSLNNLGQLYLVAKDYSAAQEKFSQAKEINDEIGNRNGLSANYLNLGFISIKRGDPEGAMNEFDESLKLCREDVDRACEAQALNAKGLAAFKMGDYERAEKLFLAALDIAKALKRHMIAAACFQNMGKLREAQDALDSALSYYERALEQDRMVEYSLGIAEDLTNMARIYEKLGQLPNARDALERTFAVYVQFGLKDETLATINCLEGIALRQGDTQAANKYRARRKALRMTK